MTLNADRSYTASTVYANVCVVTLFPPRCIKARRPPPPSRSAAAPFIYVVLDFRLASPPSTQGRLWALLTNYCKRAIVERISAEL